MKELFYSVYALLFNICVRLFRVKKNRVCFISMHNENFCDSLGCVYEELKKRDDLEFVFITRQDLEIKAKNIFRVLKFFFSDSRKLAASAYVFLNDNFLPMAKLNFAKETTVVQLWHAEGVFKKFGLAIEQPPQVRKNETEANKRLTYVVCSSEGVRPYYAQAFGVSEESVLALGSPRTDYLLKKGNEEKAREKIDTLYPFLKGKKLVLYAPTFRDDLSQNENILSHFDFELFKKELSREYSLLVRLHPQIHAKSALAQGVLDVTDYPDVRELVLSCDVLITDYSSICMDFALLSKKTVFFAYDLEDYISQRDFYFDFEEYVPGRVARDTRQIVAAIRSPFDKEKNERFKSFNFGNTDGQSAKRIVQAVVKSIDG